MSLEPSKAGPGTDDGQDYKARRVHLSARCSLVSSEQPACTPSKAGPSLAEFAEQMSE